MTREELQKLGVSDEIIDTIMDLNGKAVNSVRAKLTESEAKLESLKQELTMKDETIAKANEQIKSFDGLSAEEVATQSKAWETKYAELEEAKKIEIEAITREHLSKEALTGVKFSSKAAEKAYLHEFMEAGLPITDGAFLGVDDFFKKARESDPDAFLKEEPAEGALPKFSNPVDGAGAAVPIHKMAYADFAAQYQE